MSPNLTIEAVYENGVFRPCTPPSIASPQKVTLIVQTDENKREPTWPDDTAAIYQDIADEDRWLAQAMQKAVKGSKT